VTIKMRTLMSGWTEQHVPIALALVVATLAGGVAVVQPGPYPLVGVAAVLVTALGALFLDAFSGLVLGVGAAAAMILSRRLTDQWTPESFRTSLSLVTCLIVLGWLVGMVSAGIHGRRNAESGGDGAVTPAYGSLGLLTEDVAVARLEDEVGRARSHHRPLAVVVIGVRITDDGLDPLARDAAHRAVARLVETLLRDTDVPFALRPDELGAILPETDAAGAWDVVGPVLDAATRAAFTVRQRDDRRNLVECAELSAGLAVMTDQLTDAASLLDAAREAARMEQVESSHRHAGPGATT
jgi:GGDEF domain-containing protein